MSETEETKIFLDPSCCTFNRGDLVLRGVIHALVSYELCHKPVCNCCEASGVPQLAV